MSPPRCIPEGSILESASPIPGNDGSILQLLHDDDRIQDTRYRSRRQKRRPDDRVWCSNVVQEFGRSAKAFVSYSGPMSRKGTYECRSAGMTDMLRTLPVLKYASLKVVDPWVKKEHCEACLTPDRMYSREQKPYLSGPGDTVKTCTSFHKPFHPNIKRLFTSRDPGSELWD